MLAFSFVLSEQATSTTTTTTTYTTTTTDTNTTTTNVTVTGSIDNKRASMSRNTCCSDLSKVSQNRNSAEHISLNPLTKGVQSTAPPKPKPKPKPKKSRPIVNTENKKKGCSVLPGSISSAAGDIDKVDICQNFSEKNLPGLHIPPAMEQFTMHNEEPINVAENFKSNNQ